MQSARYPHSAWPSALILYPGPSGVGRPDVACREVAQTESTPVSVDAVVETDARRTPLECAVGALEDLYAVFVDGEGIADGSEFDSLPNRRSRKPEEIGRRSRRALTHAVAHSQAVSIVHGRLIGSAFATAPVLCLTLAKWETVSGQFGGSLTPLTQVVALFTT